MVRSAFHLVTLYRTAVKGWRSSLFVKREQCFGHYGHTFIFILEFREIGIERKACRQAAAICPGARRKREVAVTTADTRAGLRPRFLPCHRRTPSPARTRSAWSRTVRRSGWGKSLFFTSSWCSSRPNSRRARFRRTEGRRRRRLHAPMDFGGTGEKNVTAGPC